MKIKSKLINASVCCILLCVFMLNHTLAQKSNNASLNIQPISIGIFPQIKCQNFNPEDSAKAAEYAHRFLQDYTQLFDSLTQVNPGFVLLKKNPTNADLQLTIRMSHIKQEGDSFKNFNGELSQYFQIMPRTSDEQLMEMTINAPEFHGFNDTYYNLVKGFVGPHLLYSFLNRFAPYNTILQPTKRKVKNQVILQRFTTKHQALKPLALKLNHLVNNTLASYQNKKMKRDDGAPSSFLYDFQYTPGYNSKTEVTPVKAFSDDQVHIQGNLVVKNKKYYELKFKFIGKNVEMKLLDTSVKTSLLLNKGLIDSGNYSEAIVKINQNISLFILSNYR